VRQLGAQSIVVSGQGLREGVAYDELGTRPESAVRVRDASIAALVARFGSWDPNRAERRVRLAERLFAAVEPEAKPSARERLRHGATCLDIGRSVDYYRRFEHTAEILVSSDLGGFSHRKLALLAAVVRFAGGETGKPTMYRPLLTAEDRLPVLRAAVTLSLADEIEHRVTTGTLGEVRCVSSGRSAVITAPLFDRYRQEVLGRRFRQAFGRELRWTHAG
jgi:exopolyphosphatase/pppGpp-phosphohydrolase